MRISWIAAWALLGTTLFSGAAQAQQRIGVVHVNEIVNNMAEYKKAMQAGAMRENDAKTEQKKRAEAAQTLEAQRDQFQTGSAQWMDLRKQFEHSQIMNQVWAKETEINLGRAAKDDLKKMFDHVNEATQQVAIKQHINLVVADAAPEVVGPQLDSLTFQQFASLLAQRVVLFADKSVDITQDVLAQVDLNYLNPQGGAVPAPVAAPAPAPKK